MAPKDKNGKGQGTDDEKESVSKSVFLVKVNKESGKASFARIPFDTPNSDGEVFVRTSEDMATLLSEAAVHDAPPKYRKAAFKNAQENVRALRNAAAFVTVDIDLEDLVERKKKTTKPVETPTEPDPVETEHQQPTF